MFKILPKVFICFLLTSSAVLAQQQVGTISETSKKSVYEIDFDGGSLDSFVNLVKQMNDGNGEPIQIVVTKSAKEFIMPTIEVTTNIEGAIGIIEACSTRSETVFVDSDQSGNVMIVRVDRQDPPKMVIINVKQLLESVDQESLLSAITVGMEMLGPSEKVQLKLHKETGLFFAKGSTDTCQLVHDVIQQLEQGVTRISIKSQNGGGSSHDSK